MCEVVVGEDVLIEVEWRWKYWNQRIKKISYEQLTLPLGRYAVLAAPPSFRSINPRNGNKIVLLYAPCYL